MKSKKMLTLFASLALAIPSVAQTVIIDATMNNGSLEGGVAAPFAGESGTLSTGVIADHTTGTTAGSCISIDLTDNNGEGQWKAVTDPFGSGVVGNIADDTELATLSVWVYIPTATTFGGAAGFVIQLEESSDGISYSGVSGAFKSLNLTTAARDVWIENKVSGLTLSSGTTNLRTRACNISTVQTLAGGTINASNTDSQSGTGLPMAVPGDWVTEGYTGVIYLDDFSLFTEAAPTPPPAGTLVCDNFNNGNFEATVLDPWDPARSAGSIETTIVQEGSQSLAIDMSADGLASNRWRGLGLGNLQLPAVDGDMIGTSTWVYVPTATTFGTNADWRLEVRTDRNTAGNGNEGPPLQINLATVPRDVWTLYTQMTLVEDGDQTLTSVNTSGWHIETENGVDQAALGYTGMVYFDDVKFLNLGQPTPDPDGTIVGPNTQNGDLEGSTAPAPFGGPTEVPWGFSGAGSSSSAQDHTTGTGNSVCVDLTANNSNAQWKGQHDAFPEIDPIALGYDRLDISTWVYIPTATTFGTTAALNFPVVVKDPNAVDPNANIFINNGTGLDLTTANRDEWIEVAVSGIDIAAYNFLAINNWNLETLTLIGPTGQLVRADGTDGTAATGSDTGADLVGPAVPADWMASGYDGVFYMDDISVVAYSSTADLGPISINSITYDGTDAVINYNTSFTDAGFSGVDIYYSTDLVNWTADVFVTASGNDLEVTRPSGDAARYYIFVEPGETPNFGNFDAPPVTEG